MLTDKGLKPSATNSGYYRSPHAQAVFAVKPGPLRITWRRSDSSTNASPPSGVGTVVVLGIPYVVFTNQYVVSGSPVPSLGLMAVFTGGSHNSPVDTPPNEIMGKFIIPQLSRD